MNLIFSFAQAESFSIVSGDKNPLHLDPEYAKRTQFGRPVVFGMQTVITALSQWAHGRPIFIKKIFIQFKKPVYFNEPYKLEISESASSAVLNILKGDTIRSKITLEWELLPDAEAFTQFDVLMWASRHVGMVNPGTQALFSEAKFEFIKEVREGEFAPKNLKSKNDKRFNLVSISGSAKGVKSLELKAFIRPPAIHYSMSEIKSVISSSKRLKGQIAVVSGAARGFGSVIARALSFQGATVILNSRFENHDLNNVANEIKETGGSCFIVAGDIGDEKESLKIKETIEKKHGPIAILINNAFPHLQTSYFREQSYNDFRDYVMRAVDSQARPLHLLLPLVKENGIVVNISSVAVTNGEPQFSHYIAAKGAIDALVRCLASEYGKINFLNARLPRFLTDQTSQPYQLTEPESAILVAHRLLEKIRELPPGQNFQEYFI